LVAGTVGGQQMLGGLKQMEGNAGMAYVSVALPFARAVYTSRGLIVNPGRLTNIGGAEYRSAAGLRYTVGSGDGHRVFHVMSHGIPDLGKANHTVFAGGPGKVLSIVDRAWANRGAGVVQGNGNTLFRVNMGEVVGTAGERHVDIVIKAGTLDEIVTAYPTP
jgi:hypothetical protein